MGFQEKFLIWIPWGIFKENCKEIREWILRNFDKKLKKIWRNSECNSVTVPVEMPRGIPTGNQNKRWRLLPNKLHGEIPKGTPAGFVKKKNINEFSEVLPVWKKIWWNCCANFCRNSWINFRINTLWNLKRNFWEKSNRNSWNYPKTECWRNVWIKSFPEEFLNYLF